MGPFRAARMPARLLTAGSAVAGAAIVVGASVANADSGAVVLNAAPQSVEVRATLLAETAKHDVSIDELRAATVEARLAIDSSADVLGDDAEAILAARAALEDAIAAIVAASGFSLEGAPADDAETRTLTGRYTVSSLSLSLARTELEQAIADAHGAVDAELLSRALADYAEAESALESALASGKQLNLAYDGEVADNATRADLKDANAAATAALAAAPDETDLDSIQYATTRAVERRADVWAAIEAVKQSHAEWTKEQAAKAAAAAAAAAQATSYGSSGGSTYSGSSGSTSSGSSGSSSSSSGSSSGSYTPTISASGNAYTLCAEINSARAANGVPKLRSCYQSSTRQAHANRMASAGTIWHESAPEIVGMAGSVSQMMWASGGYGFMSSAGHRNIILTKGYTTASVACATGSPYVYCVAVFG